MDTELSAAIGLPSDAQLRILLSRYVAGVASLETVTMRSCIVDCLAAQYSTEQIAALKPRVKQILTDVVHNLLASEAAESDAGTPSPAHLVSTHEHASPLRSQLGSGHAARRAHGSGTSDAESESAAPARASGAKRQPAVESDDSDAERTHRRQFKKPTSKRARKHADTDSSSSSSVGSSSSDSDSSSDDSSSSGSNNDGKRVNGTSTNGKRVRPATRRRERAARRPRSSGAGVSSSSDSDDAAASMPRQRLRRGTVLTATGTGAQSGRRGARALHVGAVFEELNARAWYAVLTGPPVLTHRSANAAARASDSDGEDELLTAVLVRAIHALARVGRHVTPPLTRALLIISAHGHCRNSKIERLDCKPWSALIRHACV
ncbi:hypothetical protein EON66_00820 [archaeon]|nr:MAG: hypothetical protein EON66_00820 [archaeon]